MGRKTKNDPNGQSGNAKRAFTGLRKRLKTAQQRVLVEFNHIPRSVVNAKDKYYSYEYDIEYLWLIIQSILNGELGVQYEKIPYDWWYKANIELPWRQGTLDEVSEFNRMVDLNKVIVGGVPVQTISVQPILFSPQYTKGLRNAYAENYNLIKSLSQTTAKQVYQVINDGMKAALQPSEIKQQIKERFNVSESSAKRIARTETNRAYADARLNTVQQLQEQSGVEMGVIHISALLPTTRPHHAERNRHIYTVEQQRKWWDTGSNRINCYCSVRTAVFDENGELLPSNHTTGTTKDMRNE